MNVQALVVARLLVVLALFPALAGCAGDEPLQQGVITAGDPPVDEVTPTWASLDEATVRPGMIIETEARDCLSNFLFVRPDNGAVFIGTTANCVRDLPIGSLATVGDDRDGLNILVLVYSSWQTMADIGEQDTAAHEYNDFAVFHLDSSAARRANPALLDAPGPSGMVADAGHGLGDRVRTFAPTDLPPATHWREGVVTGTVGEWALLAHNVLPGAPGTMGGAVIDPEGRAVGVMVNLGVVPNPGANGIARLDTIIDYAREHARLYIELATAA